MKKILITLLLTTAACFASRAEKSFDGMWDRANTAYVNANYDRALEGYDSIYAAGYSSYKLFYNLGNTYFKKSEVGKAILNYNRALRLAPTDSDIKHNLTVANTYVKDNIEVVPVFFLKSWMHSLRSSLGSNTWAVLSLVFLAVSLAATLFYLLSKSLGKRKSGFFGGLAMFILFIMALGFSITSRREMIHSEEAIIMSGAVPVKSSPDSSSKELFILHEGTKVHIVGTLDSWREIQIADGNKGWIQENYIEVI